MDECTKPNQQGVNIDSEDFKAGYRQGYIDGMEEMADKVIERLHNLDKELNDGK